MQIDLVYAAVTLLAVGVRVAQHPVESVLQASDVEEQESEGVIVVYGQS